MRNFSNDSNPWEIDDLSRQISQLEQHRQELIRRGTSKPMEPKDEQLVNLAHEAGQMSANYLNSERKVEQLDKSNSLKQERIETLVSRVDRLSDERSEWRERAEVAEAKLARLQKRLNKLNSQ